jgi:hypothetical protein
VLTTSLTKVTVGVPHASVAVTEQCYVQVRPGYAGKCWWCRTSNGWWRYINSPCNCLRALSSITTRIRSPVSSGSCFCTTNRVDNITYKSYCWCTACISSSNSNVSCRTACLTGKCWWCRTSNGWWRYINSPCNCLRALSSITTRISSPVSSGSCFCTTNGVDNITYKSYCWCTACISSSNKRLHQEPALFDCR